MSKSKKTTTQQQSTVTPTNPGWVTGAVQGQQNLVDRLKGRDPTDFVAPSSPLQNMAFGLGGGLAERMQGGTTLDFESIMGTQPQSLSPIPSLYNPSGPSPQTVQTGGGRPAGQGFAPMQTGGGRPAGQGFAPMQTGGGRPAGQGLAPVQTGGGRPAKKNDGLSRTYGGSAPLGGGSPPPAPVMASLPTMTAGGSPLRTATAPGALDPVGIGLPQTTPQGTSINPLMGRNDGPNNFANSVFNPPDGGFFPQPGGGFFPQTGAPVPGGVIDGLGGETPEQQVGADPSLMGQVDPIGLGSPNPNDFFAGAGLLAAQAGLSGANTVGGVAGSYADTLGPAAGYNASGPARTAGYGASGPASADGYNASGLANVDGYNAAGPANVGGYGASGPASADGYDAAGRAAVDGYDASGRAATERAQTSLLSDPASYAASLVNAQGAGGPSTADLGGYGAAQGSAQSVGDLPTMQAAQISQADIDRFMNPYTDQVVDATNADMQDQFGQVRAAQAANAAGSGAFGGSRYGIREAQTEGELSRALGSTLGGLRSDGFNTALGYADRDTGRRQDANAANFGAESQRAFADASAQNQFGMANMDAENIARSFSADAGNRGLLANMDAQNTFSLTDADAANQANRANAGLLSDASRYGADAANEFDRLNQAAANQVGLFNAGEGNRSALDFAGRSDAAGQFSADAGNRAALDFTGRSDAAGQFSADAGNRSALDYAGRSDTAGQFGADAGNRAALDFAGRSDTAGQFGAAEGNRAALDYAGRQDQAGAFGADAGNRSALDFAGRQDQAGAFGADAFNRSSLDFAGRRDNAGQFNAGESNRFGLSQFDANNQANFRNSDALNDMSRFNAGQQDSALMRQLSAAGLLGNLGSTIGSEDRANIGLLAGLGGQQRGIDSEYRNAEPTLVQLLASLQAQQPYNLFQGQNTTGTGTSTERTSDPMTTIGQGVQAGALLFSDARLKRNIETLGYDAKGRRWTEYEYVWGGPRQVGVIAQEIAATDPQAVAVDKASGFLMVNYGAL